MRHILFVAVMLLAFGGQPLSAQCNDDIVARCKQNIGNDALMLGAYNVSFDGKSKPIEHKIGLKKDTKYRFTLDYSDENTTPVMNIYLGGTAVVSSSKNGKHYKSIEFVCKETHGYTLVLNGKTGCMILIISAVN